MRSSLTLVVNLSLRSIRTLIFNEKGEKVYEDWLPVRTYINGSIVEQDPNEWWSLLVELLKKIFSNKDFAPNIRFMTVTSSALCLVLLDKKGNVLGRSIMVSDKRAEKESRLLKEKFSEVFKQNSAFKTDPSYMMPKILWLKNNDKKIFGETAKFLSSNDFLIYKLGNIFLTDELNAEKFYFDIDKKSYVKEILEYTGISKTNLPAVVDQGTLAGELNPELKNRLGIKHPVKLVISTYDAICALIGSSTYQEGELNNVCGTCSSYRIFSTKLPQLKENNLVVQRLLTEKMYIIGGSNNLEGGVLEWAKECFYGDSYLKDDNFLYDLLQKEAQESNLGAGGILFLPYLLGERMPFFDPDVRGAFFGIERFHTRKDIVRSVFEAVAFQARLMVEEFEKKGILISSINMSGGVAKIPFAAQLRADVLGLPVHVLSEVETTAFGAFILTLKARKKIKSIKEAEKLVKIGTKYLPNMHNHNCYSSLFLLYKQLYTQSKEMFRQKREITEKILNYRKNVLENL